MSKNLEAILADLIAIPSVTDNHQACSKALDYVESSLKNAGMHTERKHNGSYESLLATTRPTKNPKFFLYGHIDVVDAKPELFTMSTSDEALHGRGTIDMKFAIASYIYLANSLKERLSELDFGIIIVADEEKGGRSVQRILEDGYHSKAVLVPDGGSNWAIESGSKGAWTVRVDASGTGAHGSRPWDGDSASFTLLDFLHDVRREFADQNLKTNTLNISRLTTTPISLDNESTNDNPQNRVPHFASATLDFRVTTKASLALLQQKISELSKKHKITIHTLADFPPSEHDLTHPLVQQFITLLEKTTDKPHSTVISLGSNDSSYFEAKGIPSIVVKPPGGGEHADTEWIDKKGFHLFTELIGEYISTVCTQK